MKRNNANSLLLGTSIGGFAGLSISFLLMPIDGLGFLPGILFWGGLIAGVVCQIILETRRRNVFKKYNVKRESMQKPRNGLLSFNSNGVAIVVDSLLIVSVAATIVAFILTKGTGYLCFVCISVLVFIFCMHCIFNGRNFVFIKNNEKISQVLEQKKANSISKGEGKK